MPKVDKVEETSTDVLDKVSTSVVERPLVQAKKITMLGTVVSLTSRKADKANGGKFKYDTTIVTLSDIKTDEAFDVFITANQWREYNCQQHMWNGNVVNVTLEENIAGVTGYLETSDSVELTAHENSYHSFNRVIELPAMQLIKALAKDGVPNEAISMIMQDVASARVSHQALLNQERSAVPASSFSAFGGSQI